MKCPECGKETKDGRMVWPRAMHAYWCKEPGILSGGKDQINVANGMSAQAFICKECRIVQLKY